MLVGQKHYVNCRCILPQLKYMKDPPTHRFVTFSIIEEDGSVRPRYAQCNNCGVIHRVTDICTSEIVFSKENMSSIVTISDIEASLPNSLCVVLRGANADLSTYENAQFVYEQKRWGDTVILTSDLDGDIRSGKYVRILGEALFKVETFERREIVG